VVQTWFETFQIVTNVAEVSEPITERLFTLIHVAPQRFHPAFKVPHTEST